MKLLLVEDERKIADTVRQGLVENGFVVDVAADGEEGQFLARTAEYDLIILDLMLPRRDGREVLSSLRAEGNTTPILILSARDKVDDRVEGLDRGADDYLVKPFAFHELLARIRTILRRPPMRASEVLAAGDLSIDLRKHRATRAGRVLDLTSREFLLLALLARRQGEVLSRRVIMEQVWDMNFDSDSNVIDVHIRRLRSKVDDPFERKLIHTVRGAGYVLEDRG